MKQCEQERIRKSENVQQFNISDPDDLVNILGVNNTHVWNWISRTPSQSSGPVHLLLLMI